MPSPDPSDFENEDLPTARQVADACETVADGLAMTAEVLAMAMDEVRRLHPDDPMVEWALASSEGLSQLHRDMADQFYARQHQVLEQDEQWTNQLNERRDSTN